MAKRNRRVEVKDYIYRNSKRVAVCLNGKVVAMLHKRSANDKGTQRIAEAMAKQLKRKGYIEIA